MALLSLRKAKKKALSSSSSPSASSLLRCLPARLSRLPLSGVRNAHMHALTRAPYLMVRRSNHGHG